MKPRGPSPEVGAMKRDARPLFAYQDGACPKDGRPKVAGLPSRPWSSGTGCPRKRSEAGRIRGGTWRPCVACCKVPRFITEEFTVIHRQPFKIRSGASAVRASLGPSNPEDLEAHSFKIGSDEYVLLSFPIGARGPWHDEVKRLTMSEREILAQVLGGRSNAAIASARGTSPRTIANQLAAIYSKLGVRSRRQLGAKRDDAGKAT
jgi:DNA-binding CsgD family transcriptional regulator